MHKTSNRVTSASSALSRASGSLSLLSSNRCYLSNSLGRGVV